MIDPKPEKQTKEIKVSAIYLPDEQWEMLGLAWIHLGYSTRMIAKNALQGFFARHKEYYVEAALRDAVSREISQSDHYQALRDGRELPRIIEPAAHPPSPIAWVPDLVSQENKRRYNSIEISTYNYTLLQVALLLDGGSLPSVISKCVYAHLGESYEVEPSDNRRPGAWARSYYPQIKLNQNNVYKE